MLQAPFSLNIKTSFFRFLVATPLCPDSGMGPCRPHSDDEHLGENTNGWFVKSENVYILDI